MEWRRVVLRAPASGGDVGYLACSGCGTLRLDPLPTGEQLAAAYDEAYFGAGATKFISLVDPIVGLSRLRRVHRAEGLLRQVTGGRPGRVLDLGCGDGFFLERLVAKGHAAAGTELSAATAKRAARVAGIDLRTGTLAESSFPAASFDLVTAWHVLEHLPEPGLTLARCRRWLAPGGMLLAAVPNSGSWQARVFGAAWFHLDPPRHLHQFSTASLARVLAVAGFEPVAVRQFSFGQNVYGVMQSTLNALGGAPAKLYEQLKGNRRQSRALRLAVAALGGFLFPPSLGFALCEALAGRGGTIEVVARRLDASRREPLGGGS
jgi:SAM-dependent methyltransferase